MRLKGKYGVKKGLVISSLRRAPWLDIYKFDFDKAMKDWLKQFPGVKWEGTLKAWLVPLELREHCKQKFEKANFKVEVQDGV